MKRLAPLALLFFTACASFNRFGDARTLGAGASSHTVAVDVWGMGDDLSSDEDVVFDIDGAVAPPMPTYVFRHGLADRLDLGISVAPYPSLGADLKWNFLRAGALDLAVVPNVTGMLFFGEEDDGVSVQASLPLLVSWRVAPTVSLIPLVGPAWRRDADSNDADTVAHAVAGLGAQFRVSERVALQPGIYAMHPLTHTSFDRRLYMGGLALSILPAESR